MAMGDNTAESGSNAGSNFSIMRFDDAGGYLAEVMVAYRATGQVKFIEQVALPIAAPTAGEHATNKLYVDTRTPKITVASTAPSSPATGDVWIDTT
jgi:hypothetical protein